MSFALGRQFAKCAFCRSNLNRFSSQSLRKRSAWQEAVDTNLPDVESEDQIDVLKQSKYFDKKSIKHVSEFPLGVPNFETVDYEISKDGFIHVLDYLPTTFKALPPTDSDLPSNWKPVDDGKFRSKAEHTTLPYVVKRNGNHNIPVYESFAHFRREDNERYWDHLNKYSITVIDNIQGDIWALCEDVKAEIMATHQLETVECQVNEIASQIKVLGHYRYCIRDFLVKNGF